jgi:hypothetical protein
MERLRGEGDRMRESMELVETMERLIESVEALGVAIHEEGSRQIAAGEAQVAAKITATVESEHEAELVRRLEEAEAKIAEREIAASVGAAATSQMGRKTVSAGVAATVAKHSVSLENVDAASLDAALTGLSVEQRIAVKSELLRAGLMG